MEEQTISFNVLVHPDMEAIAKRDAFLSEENGRKLQGKIDRSFTSKWIIDMSKDGYVLGWWCKNCGEYYPFGSNKKKHVCNKKTI